MVQTVCINGNSEKWALRGQRKQNAIGPGKLWWEFCSCAHLPSEVTCPWCSSPSTCSAAPKALPACKSARLCREWGRSWSQREAVFWCSHLPCGIILKKDFIQGLLHSIDPGCYLTYLIVKGSSYWLSFLFCLATIFSSHSFLRVPPK